MLLNTKLLFELPVYRLDKNTYYEKYNEYVDNNSTPNYNPSINTFGGEWEYNEIIGYLKFYISGGTQIRVEYSETDAKRKVKTRKKIFVLNSDSFCVRQISKKMDNIDFVKIIKECIEHCKNILPNRYIDTAFVDNTINHTDWKSVIV